MKQALRDRIARRACYRCEYCRLDESDLPGTPFHLEHVVARKHGGPTNPGNLAWSCNLCNLFKGSDLSGRDGVSGRVVRLFNPRRQRWSRHFRWQGSVLVGKTATGRATIAVLRLNLPHRIQLRAYLLAAGQILPS